LCESENPMTLLKTPRKPRSKAAPTKPTFVGFTPQQAWEPTDDDLRAIELMASRGLTLNKISAAMGLGAVFLCMRKQVGDVIAVAIGDAIDRGQAIGERSIASSLFNKAEMGDTASQIFYLKSRCGWRENQDLNVFLTTRTKEERDAIVAAAGEE
jgi:hypothetical protein